MYHKLSKSDVIFIHRCNARAIKITKEEERRLIHLYIQTQNKIYFEQLLNANMYIIIDSVLKNLGNPEDFGDMVNEAILSFHHAVLNYNPSENTKLSVYAYYKIHARLKEYKFEKSNHVFLKRHIKNLVIKFKKNLSKLDKTKQYTLEEILNETGITYSQYNYNPSVFYDVIYGYFDDKEYYDNLSFISVINLKDALIEKNENNKTNKNIEGIINTLVKNNVPRPIINKLKKILNNQKSNLKLTEKEKELILKHTFNELKLWR